MEKQGLCNHTASNKKLGGASEQASWEGPGNEARWEGPGNKARWEGPGNETPGRGLGMRLAGRSLGTRLVRWMYSQYSRSFCTICPIHIHSLTSTVPIDLHTTGQMRTSCTLPWPLLTPPTHNPRARGVGFPPYLPYLHRVPSSLPHPLLKA